MNDQVLLKHRKRILSWIKDQPALSKPRDQLLKFNRFFILLTILLIVSAIGVFGFLFLVFPPINNPYPLLSFIGAFIVGMILTYKVREKLFIVLDDVFPSYAPSVIPNYGPFPPSKI